MSNLPPQFNLYYQVSRSRMGLPEVREILKDADKIDINGSIAGLPPVIVHAAISLDQEIYQLLLDHGADLEMTLGKARKYEMPDISHDAGTIAKDIGKNLAAGVANRVLGNLGLRGRGFRVGNGTGSTSVSGHVADAQDQRKRISDFIERETTGWQEIAGEYLEDLTSFACAVFRKDKRVIDVMLENYPVNPNPVLKGRTLAEIIRADGRDHMADRLEAAASRDD